MDEKETQQQAHSICDRVFNFIKKSLALQTIKTVSLGPPTNRGSAPAPSSDAIHNKVATKSDQLVEGTLGQPVASRAKVSLEKTNTSNNSDPSSSPGSLRNGQVKDDKELPPIQGIAGNAMTSPPRVDKEEKSEFESCAEAEIAEDEAASQPKAPKKMVSINDRVEIHKSMKKRKKSKSFDKSNSFVNAEDESKPLKSILKVGSNLDEKTDTCVNQNS